MYWKRRAAALRVSVTALCLKAFGRMLALLRAAARSVGLQPDLFDDPAGAEWS